jgi:anti-sigma regulatory factor (Ser/Thr protein kinase)
VKRPLNEDVSSSMAVPAHAESIPGLIDFVASYAREMVFEEKRIEQIRLALKEALENIVRFACPTGSEEIKITCDAHEMGALLVNIADTGVPFNMLALSSFPEIAGDSPTEEIPSTRMMKKVVKDIEYRRDGDGRRNILAWAVLK